MFKCLKIGKIFYMRILSGIKPSGYLHLGNYLGAVRNWVKLQNNKKDSRLFFIADSHSLTENLLSAAEKQEQIQEMAIDLLALGLDPKKSTLFIQSNIPEVFELAWIFNCLTSMGELERMTQYKNKSSEQQENVNAGLFTYPTLMAADILLFKAEAVPVGDDQLQHLELTRETARRFNRRYGKTFPESKALLTKSARLMSLKNPLEKMSKSVADSYVGVFDEPTAIFEKIRGATTASNDLFEKIYLVQGEIVFEPSRRGAEHPEFEKMEAAVGNLLLLLQEFDPNEFKSLFANNKIDLDRLRYSELKNHLAKAMVAYFAPLRQKRLDLMKQKKKALKVYQDGAKKARAISQKTLKEVKAKIGLI